MITFREFLIERYLNLMSSREEKEKYAEQVYKMLQNAYKKLVVLKVMDLILQKIW